MFINIFAIAMDGPHRDQGEAGHPEERGLERERGQWIPCVRRFQAQLRADVFPLPERFVLISNIFVFYISISIPQFEYLMI